MTIDLFRRCLRGAVLMLAAASALPSLAADAPTAPPAQPAPAEPQPAAPQAPVAVAKPEERRPAWVEPVFVRPLTELAPGTNDSNPVWSPSGMFVAFERSAGEKKEIRIALADGTVFQVVYHLLTESAGQEMKFLFPGVVEETSYNAGLTWSPDESRFAFMSNGGEGNYDLYLAELGAGGATRLTDHKEKDGQAHWSPRGNGIVFISGRTGKGDLYLLDADTRSLTRLTRGKRQYLYPQWSPDGSRIAVTGGSNESHDIYLITDLANPLESLTALTAWDHDDIRPVWSPDGKKIAFYSNYNAAGDPKTWCIIVVAADGSDPVRGEGLAAKVVATEVVPDAERGPAWMPDSERIVYVRNDRVEYHPLYLLDLRTGVSRPIRTETKMNHDVSVSPQGVIAFRAQVDQWDHIFLMQVKEEKENADIQTPTIK